MCSTEYYINMMRAWYFATALAKQPDAALPWLTEKRLDLWTHNKAIQKAVESRRIPPGMKAAAARSAQPFIKSFRISAQISCLLYACSIVK